MMEELGSGFFLAMHDLEIRGAGEVLGESQSRRDAGGRLPALRRHAERRGVGAEGGPRARPRRAARRHHRDQPARAGAAARGLLQRRARAAGALQAPGQLRDAPTSSSAMQEELVDRFGALPEPAQALLACHRLRLVARPLGVVKIDAGPERSELQFAPEPAVRRRQADPAGAERRPDPLRRPRPRAHRARRARAGRARRAAARLPRRGSPEAPMFAAAAAAGPRVRPRLAVGEPRAAEEPRRPRADRLGLRAATRR